MKVVSARRHVLQAAAVWAHQLTSKQNWNWQILYNTYLVINHIVRDLELQNSPSHEVKCIPISSNNCDCTRWKHSAFDRQVLIVVIVNQIPTRTSICKSPYCLVLYSCSNSKQSSSSTAFAVGCSEFV